MTDQIEIMTPDDKRYYDDKFKHIEDLMEEHEKLDQLRHSTENEARKLAFSNMEIRMHDMNQLRQEVLTDRALYVTRELHDRLEQSLDGRIKLLEVAQGETYGKDTGKSAVYAGLMAIAVVVTQIVLHFWK